MTVGDKIGVLSPGIPQRRPESENPASEQKIGWTFGLGPYRFQPPRETGRHSHSKPF